MARIRTIKPEIWQDEKLSPLDPLTRLVFLALISLADDAGRLVDNLRLLDASMFPETDDSCRDALAKLSGIGRIRRGTTASGQRIIQIANWEKHQKVDHPNLKAALPEIVETQCVTEPRDDIASRSREPSEAFVPHTNDLRPVPTTYDRRPESRDVRESLTQQPDQHPVVPLIAYEMPERELRDAGAPHMGHALTALMSRHSQPYAVVYELYACATGLHVLRGKQTGNLVTPEHVMAAIWEMAVNDSNWNVSLFRGYARRIADRPISTATPEEKQLQKVAAEAAKFAQSAPMIGEKTADGAIVSRPAVIEDDTTEAAAERRAKSKAAMEKLRAEWRVNTRGENDATGAAA